jgi:hypothetical protein
MKKMVPFVFLAVTVGGMLFAQSTSATTTVSGTLTLKSGRIVLKDGSTTYYTRGLERFIGFIDGLQDGAQVTMEGYVSAPSIEGENERLFFPVKLTLSGKIYEVGPTMTTNYGRGYYYGNPRMGRGACRRWDW